MINMPSVCKRQFPECVTQYFSLSELTKTSQPFPNQPDSPVIVANLRELALTILHPLYEEFGPNLIINSAFRSAAVNAAVGSTSKSQHLVGQAADVKVRGMSTYDLAFWVRDHLKDRYGQLILEEYVPNTPSSGWVHCGLKTSSKSRTQTKFKHSKVLHDGLLMCPPNGVAERL